MTHDPMCHSLTEAEGLDVYYNGPVGGSDHIECITCYYIVKIRAEERKRAALRVAAVPSYDDVRFPSGVVPLVEAVVAVAARNGES